MSETGRDLDLAHAFAGVLSGREFKDLKVEVGDKICYNIQTDTITLPGVPFGDAPEEIKEDMRAYIAHESIGERGNARWRPSDYPDAMECRIINGMNDARIDRIALEEWPGAGMSIRTRLQKDLEFFKREMKTGKYSVNDQGVLSSALRYVGENIATVEEISAITPDLAKVFEKIAPALKETDFDGTEEHVIEQARKIYKLAELEASKQEMASGGEREDSEQGDGKGEEEKEKEALGKAGKGASGKESKSKEGEETEDAKDFGSMEDRLKKKLEKELDPSTATKGKQMFSLPPNSLKRVKPPSASLPSRHENPSRVLVGRIMRLFRSLQAAEDRVILKNRLLGELDPDRIAEIHRGSSRLFRARKRAETESLAVYVSVDLTGSMGWLWYSQASQFVQALNEALGRLEIPTAIVGWSGTGVNEDWRRHFTQPYSTRFVDMKTFEDTWQKAKVAIANTRCGSANADVPALGDGVSQLARRTESRKLLFYITDGSPCLDYPPDFPLEPGLLGRTMKGIVEKGKLRGITTVACGLGLESYSRTTMNNIFGEGSYAEIPMDASLEAALGTQFEKAIKRIVTQTERRMK